jgi:hypothetical protein
MYIIKAQYKHNKAVVIDQVDRKEDVFNLCIEYLFSFGDGRYGILLRTRRIHEKAT